MINVSTNALLVDYMSKANIPLADILWYLSLKEPRDINSESATPRSKVIFEKLQIAGQSVSVSSMFEAGVSPTEIVWYLEEARPRNFKGDGDVHRAQQIYKNVFNWTPHE